LEVAGAEASAAQNDPQYPLGNPPPEHLFGFNTYYQGAALVHALRQEMGDEAFFAGLRSYFQQFGGRTASDAQFQAVMEAAANKSLDGFFAEWLN
jgi:aminopeptidase N